MKILTNKKYYELNAKLWDQEQELTRKRCFYIGYIY